MLKPHVLHVINNLNVSGATTLLLDVTAYVRPGRGEITICTLEPDNPMADALLRAGARLAVPPKRLNTLAAVSWVIEVIKDTDPAIVHTHLLPASQVGLAAGRLAHKRTVTTVHYMFDQLRANFLLRRLNRASYRFYDRIFAISNAVKQSILRNCRVPDDRVAVLLSGVDFARAAGAAMAGRQEMRRRFGCGDGDVVIGSIGRLEEIKGYHVLLEAVARLRAGCPAAKVLLVGDGASRQRLQWLAAKLQLGDVVAFAGTQKDPAAFLAAMDVFVLPSESEGLGLSIIEAMAAGLPVIGSNAGGIPEVVTHCQTGLLFESKDAADLARCLADLVGSPDLSRKLAAAGRAAAEEKFGIAKYVGRLYEEYDRTLHPSQRPEPGRFARPAPKEAST